MAGRKRSSSRPALPAALKARHRRLGRAIKQADAEALLVTNPNDIRYLTGFSGEDSYALVTGKDFTILSDSRFEEELAPLASWAHLVIRRNESMAQATAEAVSGSAVKTVALQADHLTIGARQALAKEVGQRKLKDTNGILSKLRVIKDDDEVKAIRKAIQIQEQALRATLECVAPGQTEAQIAARLEYEIKARGADGAAFRAIVAAGANSSMPHYHPSPKVKTKAKSVVLIDWGARLGGYCGDLTRTFALGAMPPKIREIYQITLEAQMMAIDAIRPGARCRDVDAVARDHITAAGYGEQFGHGLGHGLGLDVHEAPSLSRRAAADATLEPGMIVTVEPGIYLPGVGGVRIEDDVLVTERGRTALSRFPKDIESAVLLV